MDLQALVTTFYTDCLTVNPRVDAAAVMATLLADDFQSHGSVEVKTKAQLIGQIGAFWRLVPDLVWEPQELLQAGNRVVVRSIARGTPKGDFMGLATDGRKPFRIMTIDIHTVEHGQIRAVHHLEDWATAMQQLR